MGLTAKYSMTDVRAFLKKKEKQLDQNIIEIMREIGEKFANSARSSSTYQDHTGNLRSSVGFIVTGAYGRTIYEDFKQSPRGSDRATGVAKGRAAAVAMKKNAPKAYALIVVAGMDYAAYVEATGRDVITGSSLEAKRLLRNAIRRIKHKR